MKIPGPQTLPLLVRQNLKDFVDSPMLPQVSWKNMRDLEIRALLKN